MKYSLLTLALLAAQALGAPLSQEELQDWMQRSNGVYSLHEAARTGNTEVLAARIKEGADVNQRNELGITPLHFAAYSNNAEAVQMLLQAGADTLAKDGIGRIPSALAAKKDIRDLIVAQEESRAYELEVAALIAWNSEEALEAIATLPNPNARAEDGAMSLLAMAVSGKHEAAARALADKGADPNYRLPSGEYILHLCVEYASPELTAYLLEKGADPMKEVKADNCTPLHYAVWDNRVEQVRALLPSYKDCNFNPGMSDRYPAHWAVMQGKNEILKAFLEAGMDVNHAMFDQLPLLIAATRRNDAEAVKLLLDAGADKSRQDKDGKTAADYATGECAELLH